MPARVCASGDRYALARQDLQARRESERCSMKLAACCCLPLSAITTLITGFGIYYFANNNSCNGALCVVPNICSPDAVVVFAPLCLLSNAALLLLGLYYKCVSSQANTVPVIEVRTRPPV
jgi:hypothetical protein